MEQNAAKKITNDSDEDCAFFDKLFHVFVNQQLGVSPAFNLSLFDWLLHLSISPEKQIQLMQSAYQKAMQLREYALQYYSKESNLPSIGPQVGDRRFRNDSWKEFPFNLYSEAFLLFEQFWKEAIDTVPGITKHHKLMNHFILQQILNIISPTNGVFTNPEILSVTNKQKGANFIQGFNNLLEDIPRKIASLPQVGMEKFQVGKNLAITPGKIVYRNELIELIQYTPTTNEVYKEPILIVPACIMKYYILDLSENNSLVKYLVSQGHTVFMISWKNPTYQDSNLGFDDYINLGLMSAIDTINNIIPNTQIHTVGYCLGGTMLAVTAAYMAGKSDARLKTVTLLAAQVDFQSAGELLVFMDESQLSMLKDSMWKQGYLDGPQMANAFNVMHSNELIWGRIVQDYLIGDRRPLFDVMAWNSDVTRLPAKMHSEYLEELFLTNSLIQGNFAVNNEGISLSNIDVPIFAVGTVADHVAPWKSVYKINFFTKVDVTFVLTTGGHNVGIVSEPGHKGRSYQVKLKKQQDKCLTQDAWQKTAPTKEGSWWVEWESWLVNYSDVTKVQPPGIGNKKKGYPVLGDAPGTYVLQK